MHEVYHGRQLHTKDKAGVSRLSYVQRILAIPRFLQLAL